MIKSLGSLTLAAVNLSAGVALSAALNLLASQTAKAGELAARLKALLTPPVLPTPAQMGVQFAANLLAYNPAQILASLLSLAPSVQLEIAGVQASLSATQSVVADLQGALSAGGLRLYSFEGKASALANELGGAVSADVDADASVKALVIVTESAAAWAALATTMKVS